MLRGRELQAWDPFPTVTEIQDLVSPDVSPLLLLPLSPKPRGSATPQRGDIVTPALLSPRGRVTPPGTMQSPRFTQLRL